MKKKNYTIHEDIDSLDKRTKGDAAKILRRFTKVKGFKHYNIISLIGDMETRHVLVGVSFADILNIDISTGTPELDTAFHSLTKEDKLKEIELLLYSVGGLVDSIDQLQHRLLKFSSKLLDLEKELTQTKEE